MQSPSQRWGYPSRFPQRINRAHRVVPASSMVAHSGRLRWVRHTMLSSRFFAKACLPAVLPVTFCIVGKRVGDPQSGKPSACVFAHWITAVPITETGTALPHVTNSWIRVTRRAAGKLLDLRRMHHRTDVVLQQTHDPQKAGTIRVHFLSTTPRPPLYLPPSGAPRKPEGEHKTERVAVSHLRLHPCLVVPFGVLQYPKHSFLDTQYCSMVSLSPHTIFGTRKPQATPRPANKAFRKQRRNHMDATLPQGGPVPEDTRRQPPHSVHATARFCGGYAPGSRLNGMHSIPILGLVGYPQPRPLGTHSMGLHHTAFSCAPRERPSKHTHRAPAAPRGRTRPRRE